MNATVTTRTSNRITAGVTTAYLLDLTRRPAPAPGDGRRTTMRRHRVAAARVGRDRDDCDRRRTDRRAAV